MSFNLGMAWVPKKGIYKIRFGEPAPNWISVFDLPKRLDLVSAALRIGWRLPTKVLLPDEFHRGRWSVWDSRRLDGRAISCFAPRSAA